MKLYRVFPYDSAAPADAPGGALFASPGRGGPIDNPEAYDVLYCSSTPEGAISETFGRIPEWNADMLARADGRRYALATFEMHGSVERVYDLDDAQHLVDRSLRPSQVVTRNRDKTQAWALRIFEQRSYDGISWWSYYKPEWLSAALWTRERLRLDGEPHAISLASASLRACALELARVVR